MKRTMIAGALALMLGLVLVALFIWFAENIGTFTSAWIYPSQRHGWAPVPVGKLGAWYADAHSGIEPGRYFRLYRASRP